MKEKITNSIKNLEVKPGTIYYIISAVWIDNLFSFIDDRSKKIEKKFDKSQVCLNYFSERTNDYSGAYPGPINNYYLINFKDVWIDSHPNFFHTNLIMKNNLKEKTDYFLVEKKDFEDLNTYFDCYFTIQRKSIEINNEILVEVNLFKIKVLILNDILKKNCYKYLISPKYLQLSRIETLSELKMKIFRCINTLLNDEHKLNENTFQVKIYNPEKPKEKNLIFEIIYSYVNGQSKFFFEGEEIAGDHILIQVRHI